MKELSLRAKLYILGTILIGIILFGWYLPSLDQKDFWTLLGLSGLASLSLILKIEGVTERSHYNISFIIYGFSFVLLGMPATMLVVFTSNLVEWVWHKYPWYIPCFNIASYIIVVHGTGMAYKWVNPGVALTNYQGILGILVAMGVFTLINHFMVGVVVWLARGENFSKSGVFDFLPLMIDFTLLCMGAGSALLWTLNPFATILTFLPLYLIYTALKVPALERKSETDPKTGLFNASYFSRFLESELNRANRFDRPLTVVMADLDLLRNINNTYGHLAGDEVLIGMANILKQSVREYDIVARFGGEEFAILIPEMTPQEAYPRIEEIRSKVENAEFTAPTSVTPIKATLSFGIAGREGFDQSPSDIVHNADAALYRAKLRGRNRAFVYTDEDFKGTISADMEDVPYQKEISLEERVKLSEIPYVPNPLREKSDINISSKSEEQESAPAPGTESRPKWVINLYIASVTLTALILFGISFKPGDAHIGVGLAVFALAVILTEGASIDIYVRETSISTSAAPMLAGILLFGPIGVGVLSVTFALVAMIKHRSPVNRFIFNFGNQMLAGLLYTIPIMWIGTPFVDYPLVGQIALSLVSAGIVYVSTTILIAMAMSMTIGLSFKQVWREQFSWLAPYYITMGIIAYALIFSYKSAGFLGVVVILAPLLILRLSQKQYVDRTKAIVVELRENNVKLENYAQEIAKLSEGLLNALAETVDLRDPFVLGHSKQVARYSVLIAQKLGLHAKQIELVRRAGLLHDIGKIGIPDSILRKPGSLTTEEFEMIKIHASLGAELLEKSHSLRDLIPIVRHHHERFDGSGYPDRLSGYEIPLEARILGVADAVEAMASDRPYRKALDYQEILAELQVHAGTQFDPLVVETFVTLLELEGDFLIVNSARKQILEYGLPAFVYP